MNRAINLTLWAITLFIIGALIAHERGIYMKNEALKECTQDVNIYD
jgi:hypothetical protein